MQKGIRPALLLRRQPERRCCFSRTPGSRQDPLFYLLALTDSQLVFLRATESCVFLTKTNNLTQGLCLLVLVGKSVNIKGPENVLLYGGRKDSSFFLHKESQLPKGSEVAQSTPARQGRTRGAMEEGPAGSTLLATPGPLKLGLSF